MRRWSMGRANRRRHGLNRAVALRIAVCGLMALGAALLIAALLLSTYTIGKIAKFRSSGHHAGQRRHGDRPRPGVIGGRRIHHRRQCCRWRCNSRSAWSRRRTDVVTVQVGSTLRHTTSSRTPAYCWRWWTPSRSTAAPRWPSPVKATRWRGAEAANHRGRPAADQYRAAARGAGVPVPVRHREEDLSVLRPDRPEAVRRQLRRGRGCQRPDHLPVHPERRI